MEVVNKILEFLNGPIGLLIGGFAVDMIRRYIKSDKPQSFAHDFAKIARLFAKVAEGLADYSDKIFGQRVKKVIEKK